MPRISQATLAVHSIKMVQTALARKIGIFFDFSTLSNTELSLYFVFFDGEIIEMVNRLEELCLRHGDNSLETIRQADLLQQKILLLKGIWDNFDGSRSR